MLDTRELILKSAQSLFAEKGFESVSVRDITRHAGVNLASVSYHYGGKDGLTQEVIKSCLGPVYQYGMTLLKEAEVEYGSLKDIPLEELINRLLRPILLSEECGVSFDMLLRITARYLIELDYLMPIETQRLMGENFQAFGEAFQLHFPNATKDQITKYIIFIEGAAIYTSGIGAGTMQLLKGEAIDRKHIDRKKILEDIVCCSVSGFGQVE